MPGRMWLRRARGRGKHVPGQMNSIERDYGQYLDLRKQAGEIIGYWFERFKFKLADNTYFTPDYMVQLADGIIEFIDTKGAKKIKTATGTKPGYWAEEDAKVKIKVAADQYPLFVFKVAFKVPGDGWREEEV